jgi:hypothetical protein
MKSLTPSPCLLGDRLVDALGGIAKQHLVMGAARTGSSGSSSRSGSTTQSKITGFLHFDHLLDRGIELAGFSQRMPTA